MDTQGFDLIQWAGRIVIARETEFIRVCLQRMSEAMHMKPYQHDCLSMSYARITPRGIQTWMEKTQEASILDKKLQAIKKC